MRRGLGSRKIRGEDGAAAVEFAIVVVILVWIIVAVIEFGAAYTEYQVYTGAAREGARMAATNKTTAAITSSINAAAEPYDPPTGVSVTVNGAAAGTTPCEDNPGDPVRISWEQTFDLVIFGNAVSSPGVTISGTFRCE